MNAVISLVRVKAFLLFFLCGAVVARSETKIVENPGSQLVQADVGKNNMVVVVSVVGSRASVLIRNVDTESGQLKSTITIELDEGALAQFATMTKDSNSTVNLQDNNGDGIVETKIVEREGRLEFSDLIFTESNLRTKAEPKPPGSVQGEASDPAKAQSN